MSRMACGHASEAFQQACLDCVAAHYDKLKAEALAETLEKVELLRSVVADLLAAHVHSWPSDASSTANLCCERCRAATEVLERTKP